MIPVGFHDLIAVERTGAYDSGGRALWRLAHALKFESAAYGKIEVPAGFVTNYASVPRLPFVYWYCGDRVYEEPALHDFLYTTRRWPRDVADAIFLEALLLNPKVPEGMAHTMHRGVRWFGESSWNDQTSIAQPDHVRALILPS